MNEIVGHEKIKDRFRSSLARERLASTFLFVGPEGIGKRTFAIALAKSLLCEASDRSALESCGMCEGCRLMEAGNHPDFELVSKQKDKAFLQIEQFIGDRDHRNRAGLCHNLCKSPFRGGRRIAIIDDADFFNQESANCLLKILEEPPPQSVLIMVGTSEQKQLPTIRSRSQIVQFSPLAEHEVLQVLQAMDTSEFPASPESIAANSRGSLKVLDLYAEEGLFDFRDQLFAKLASFEPMTAGFPRAFMSFVDEAGKEAAKRRSRVRQLADFCIEFYTAVGKLLTGVSVAGVPEGVVLHAQDAAKNWRAGPAAATDCIERCMDAQIQLAANANQATLIECWMSDLGKLSRGDQSYSDIKVALAY